MPRLYAKPKSTSHRILIVDDSEEVLESTRVLLSKEGHEVAIVSNGRDAIEKCRDWRPHLIILDYFMPEMTGEKVVVEVRKFDQETQILLATGYASEKPPRQMLHELDIQGYHDKSEGPEKLLIWVDASLKTYRQLVTINKSKLGLKKILDAIGNTGDVHALEDLLRGVVEQMETLYGDAPPEEETEETSAKPVDEGGEAAPDTEADVPILIVDDHDAARGRFSSLNRLFVRFKKLAALASRTVEIGSDTEIVTLEANFLSFRTRVEYPLNKTLNMLVSTTNAEGEVQTHRATIVLFDCRTGPDQMRTYDGRAAELSEAVRYYLKSRVV